MREYDSGKCQILWDMRKLCPTYIVCATGEPAPSQQSSVHVPINYIVTNPANATKQAMADIRSTPKWIRRMFLLAGMKFLPILNFYETGYAL